MKMAFAYAFIGSVGVGGNNRAGAVAGSTFADRRTVVLNMSYECKLWVQRARWQHSYVG